MSNFLVRQKSISFLKYIYYAYYFYIYVYKSVSTMLDKGLRKHKKKREGEIEKQTKWNGSTEYDIEKVKQTRRK